MKRSIILALLCMVSLGVFSSSALADSYSFIDYCLDSEEVTLVEDDYFEITAVCEGSDVWGVCGWINLEPSSYADGELLVWHWNNYGHVYEEWSFFYNYVQAVAKREYKLVKHNGSTFEIEVKFKFIPDE